MSDASHNTIKLIAWYLRVSTSNQEDQKTVENQRMELRTLEDELYGPGNYRVVREYVDEGWSGDLLQRPALDEMRLDAKRGLWEEVHIYDPARLARRYSYQALVMEELNEANVGVVFRTNPAPQNSEDKILFGVKSLFDEYERAKITERFRIGKLRKARNNNIIAAEAPYGYNLVKRRGKPGDADFVETHYEIDGVEATVVRKIFDWVGNQGATTRKVVRLLHEEGVMPRKSTRGVWSTSTINSLIRNTTYIGEAHYGVSQAVVPVKPLKNETYKRNKKTSRKIRPSEEWIAIRVPAILEGEGGKELFERAQEQMRINFARCSRNKKNDYLIGGKVRCSCGCTRTGEGPQKGRHLYYRCANRVKSYPAPPTCEEKGINARIADTLVWNELVRLMSSEDLMLQQIERWQKGRKEMIPAKSDEIDVLTREMTSLKEQEKRYKTAYGAGAFTLEELQEYATPLRQKLENLQNRIANSELRQGAVNDITFPDHRQLKAFVIRVKKRLMDLNFGQKRVIVMDVVEGIIGTPRELIVRGAVPVVGYHGYAWSFIHEFTESYVKQQTSHRHCRATQRRKIDAF